MKPEETRERKPEQKGEKHLVWSETLAAAATAGRTQVLLGRVPGGPEQGERR